MLAESDPEGPADDFEAAADRHSHRPATGCAGGEDARLTVTAVPMPARGGTVEPASDTAATATRDRAAEPANAEDILLEMAADAAVVLAGSPALVSTIHTGRDLEVPVIAVDPPDRVSVVEAASPRCFADAAITEIAAFLRRMGS